MQIDFATDPARYRHWRLDIDGPVAILTLDVDPAGGLFPGTELKLNSYDLGVDIELADAVHAAALRAPGGARRRDPLRQGRTCSAPAPISARWPARATRTRSISASSPTRRGSRSRTPRRNSGQRYLAAVNGTAAGGGYELALACDHIMLIDDRRSAVSLPEVPLLAVLPGTGGLTRLTDKRQVRRDRADMFCTTEEGVRGRRALDWRLVDELVPPSSWDERVRERARELAAGSDRPGQAPPGDAVVVPLPPLDRTIAEDGISYRHVRVAFDRAGAARDNHRARPAAACPPISPASAPKGPRSGRSRWRASWMTRSCICASTSRNSASSCSAPRAIRLRSSRPIACSSAMPTTGSCAK